MPNDCSTSSGCESELIRLISVHQGPPDTNSLSTFCISAGYVTIVGPTIHAIMRDWKAVPKWAGEYSTTCISNPRK